MDLIGKSILPTLKEVKVRVGQIDVELYDEYEELETAKERISFLRTHNYDGCILYESLATFQTCLNEDNVDTENCFIDFIPYED